MTRSNRMNFRQAMTINILIKNNNNNNNNNNKNKIKTINKASIAVESREVLLDPSLFSRSLSLTSKFLLLGALDPLRHRSALRKIAKDASALTHEIVVA